MPGAAGGDRPEPVVESPDSVRDTIPASAPLIKIGVTIAVPRRGEISEPFSISTIIPCQA